jgi:DNA-directed RNA polymerase specialized sigma24 family protein
MSHLLIQDPSDISSRFSNSDKLGYMGQSDYEIGDLIDTELLPETEESDDEIKKLHFDAIEPYLKRIPEREADLIQLYHQDKMKQEQIAKLFAITQAAVSYRLHRGIKRIRFLRTIPELDFDQFELELGPKFDDQDRQILWLMYETTCQSEIAKRLRLTQGRVRHRFFRSLEKIKEFIEEECLERRIELKMEVKTKGVYWTDESIREEESRILKESRYAKYYKVFYAISDKRFNILHEVSLPQFQDRGDATILSI